MDFGLSQDQEMLCDAISRTLADTCPLDHVRECAEGSVPFSDNVRSALGEIGIWGMMVPEQHDGLGMTMLDAAVVAEQLGYAVAPVAFIGAHVLAPLALAQGGSEELKAHWLPRIAKGEAQIAVAIAETVEIRDRAGVDFDGAKLDGTALFALDFLEADAFLVADTAGRMHFVAGDAAGLEKVALKTIDRTRSVGELRFSGVAGEALADDGGATVRLPAMNHAVRWSGMPPMRSMRRPTRLRWWHAMPNHIRAKSTVLSPEPQPRCMGGWVLPIS